MTKYMWAMNTTATGLGAHGYRIALILSAQTKYPSHVVEANRHRHRSRSHGDPQLSCDPPRRTGSRAILCRPGPILPPVQQTPPRPQRLRSRLACDGGGAGGEGGGLVDESGEQFRFNNREKHPRGAMPFRRTVQVMTIHIRLII